ncbi:MAG: TetR family transcriptional regulator [Alphaproteobacteria bacterium]|nr:TetR family transcriptional regulator [Alphaproteobacteria bacterium]
MKKARSNNRNNGDDRLFKTVLALAARHGWAALTMAQIARAAKTSTAKLKQRFPGKADLLRAIIGHFDTMMCKGKAEGDTMRDRLFDILMRRFELMQPHRTGITRIMDEAREDPSLLCTIAPALRGTVLAALRAAGEGGNGTIKGKLGSETKAAGLGMVCLYAGFAWHNDTSRDLAKTMAALDRGLGYAEAGMKFLARKTARTSH